MVEKNDRNMDAKNSNGIDHHTGVIRVEGAALSDAYSVQDQLGFIDYVESLARFIESPKTEKPITIGINATWGGGKSSLMHMLERRLNPGLGNAPYKTRRKRLDHLNHFYTVWFDAWQYDQQEMLWAALVLEILRQIREQFNLFQRFTLFVRLNLARFDWVKFATDVSRSIAIAFIFSVFTLGGFYALSMLLDKDLLSTISWLKTYTKVFAGLGIAALVYTVFKDTAGLIVSPFSLGISGYVKEPDYKSKIGFVSQFKLDFGCVIDLVTQKGKWPLVVFIDDLDRCSSAKAVEVIEAISLLLDSKYCVFVIGMDVAILSRSIQAKYKDVQPFLADMYTTANSGIGRQFLEKIIQIDFQIPRPDPSYVSKFIEAQLGSYQKIRNQAETDRSIIAKSLIQAEQRIGKTSEEARQVIKSTHPELITYVNKAVESEMPLAFEDYPEVKRSIQEMSSFLDYNPRRIKRFINLYRLHALIAQQRGFLENLISLDNLARWVIVGMRWPDFIAFIMKDPKMLSEIRTNILQIQDATTVDERMQEIESIKNAAKYPSAVLPLLTDLEFTILVLSIKGKTGEAQNYLGLNQIFVAQ